MHNHQASRHAWPALPLAALIAACTAQPPAEPEQPRPQQAGQPLDPLKTAGHIAGARVAALTGNKEGVRAQHQANTERLHRQPPAQHKAVDRAALEAIPEM